LLADQKAWVASYSRACGVAPDVTPSLPLPPQVKDCMARAGRARIAYLNGYGVAASIPSSSTAAGAPGRIGPGFDCAKATAPLAQLICSDPGLSKTDLQFNQAYYALHYALDPADRRRLEAEDVEFLNSVKLDCGVPDTGTPAGSTECVSAHFGQMRSEWLRRLTGPGREEAIRPIERHIALQAQLQQLDLLPLTAKVDGVYSVATRAAISEWQNDKGRPVTGFISDADAALLAPDEPRLAVGLAPAGTTQPRAAPTALPPIVPAPSITNAGSGENDVALKERGGVYVLPVRINDAITLNFTLDSGASDVLIPADVLLTLVRTETISESDFLGQRTYVLADGSKLPSERVNLRELRVGGHRLTNVAANVGSPTSEPLLGQSFLSRFKSWTLDNERHVLVLNRTGQPPPFQPTTARTVPRGELPGTAAPSGLRNFEEFASAAAYRGAPVMPDFSGRDREFKDFRTRIRAGIAEGVNFAGHYKMIQFGCGTGCSFVVVADVSTGQVYRFPHGGEYDQMLRLEYRPSSILVRASWVPSLEHMDQCLWEELVFTDGRFTSLGKPITAACPPWG